MALAFQRKRNNCPLEDFQSLWPRTQPMLHKQMVLRPGEGSLDAGVVNSFGAKPFGIFPKFPPHPLRPPAALATIPGANGGCSPAAACSSRSSCCHPHSSGRRKRFHCKEGQGMGTGWLSQPAAPTYSGTRWEAAAGTPQWHGYLVKSVTGAQLLPSGKQKRGMACRRRSSSSFWPLRRFSRWNKVMPRVRVMPTAPGLCWGQGGTFWPQRPWVRPEQKVPAHPWASSSPKSQFQPVLPRGYWGTVQAPNTLQRRGLHMPPP